jgi:enoyl-CoA hydratase
MSNAIEVEQSEDKLVIKFIRPEIRNPLSVFVLDEIDEVLSDAATSIKEIVFSGSENIFASGADLREIESLSPTESREFAERGQRLMQIISKVPQTTTARINGFCYGGALDLALACDRRIATPNATFCHPGAGLGIITGWGGTQRLPRLIGEANSLKLFFTAAPIDAKEAARIGLIDAID